MQNNDETEELDLAREMCDVLGDCGLDDQVLRIGDKLRSEADLAVAHGRSTSLWSRLCTRQGRLAGMWAHCLPATKRYTASNNQLKDG